MQKIYSLLRNNKQTGPYSLEELVDLSLKPFDLIWVEGKSGGWSYPSEIDALKPYLIAKEPKQTTTEVPTSEAPQSIVAPASQTEIKKEKQPAKHIYISFPAGVSLSNKTAVATAVVTSVDEESAEAKLERKAHELKNKIQAFAEGKKEPKADNDLDTKYARSLDDIKEEYSDWLHHQKAKKVFPYKKITAVAGGGILILLVSFFFFKKQSAADGISNEIVLTEQAPLPISDSVAQAQETKEAKALANKTTKKRKQTEVVKLTKKRSIPVDRIDEFIDSLRKADAIAAAKNTKEESEKREPEVENTQKQSSSTLTKPKESAANLAQQVQLSESIGSEGSKLTIYNNSDRFLNFVAVDVFYYKSNDKLLQRKTVYFHDVAPKTSAPLHVPELKKASSVKYQMGLISTDGGLFYAKQ